MELGNDFTLNWNVFTMILSQKHHKIDKKQSHYSHEIDNTPVLSRARLKMFNNQKYQPGKQLSLSRRKLPYLRMLQRTPRMNNLDLVRLER